MLQDELCIIITITIIIIIIIMKAYRGRRGIVPLILNLGIRWI
jgi:uncharacterized membrane protein